MFPLLFICLVGCIIYSFILGRRLRESRLALRTAEEGFAAKQEQTKQSVLDALSKFEAELQVERQAALAEVAKSREHHESELRAALLQLEPLRQYQSLANAEIEVRQSISAAIAAAHDLRKQTEHYRVKTEIEAQEASERARRTNAERERILATATLEARKLVEDAHKNAERIGGEAYIALRERQELKQAVQAIRNIIDGYGDRYVIPTRSLIDDLAADFGHLEAGVRLKAARQQTRRMVEDHHAADCDYAEAYRRETAIRFVIDAFNGRVDAILSRIKEENLGVLQQEVRDSFALVNLNGQAFRHARILPAYLDARLEELRWAMAVHELRLKDREEQRRIQEQIREEEKARRDAERAMKEAEREEQLLQKALAAARAEAESASADQRLKLEERISELNSRLLEAEAKNRRAKSMAELTRAGTVYVISNVGSFGDGIVKIGMTRRLDPMDRVYELGDASVPFEFDVHAMISTDDAPSLERELHAHFAAHRVNRVNFRKEFFRVNVQELRDLVASKGLEAAFTMAAEAREYRESLAVTNSAGARIPIDPRAEEPSASAD